MRTGRELGWDRLRTVPEYVKFGEDLHRQEIQAVE